ncbi:MAG TPA: bifunctional 2-polyprenyl-6-hydroxyphenol methylase/3-demethylubiquinol 3-O-methyltransferase UbiG [Ktedonobacterales bacterium]|nr:bifunctional 2-polyprenyl-6-hydroxyphenol methylase/3-demethylubiquinol 3-O-methyltransferase UbiG [Ktedonobacterales bacterium]
MPVDNELYNQSGDIWWGETGALSLLRTALNPARFAYFRQTLTERLKLDPRDLCALDVGCGGGLLAEEFARLGCQVTGIDPSAPSIATARAHASQAGLAIAYQVGVGEQLPFADASFDLVYCCDVLEHVSDVERVIAETARVLKPGGVYCFDTINRTLFSKLVTIKLFQEWQATAFLPPRLHAWEQYVTPAELKRLLVRHSLAPQEIIGLTPEANPLRLLWLLRRYKRGALSFQQLSAAARFKAGGHTLASYLGYALKA